MSARSHPLAAAMIAAACALGATLPGTAAAQSAPQLNPSGRDIALGGPLKDGDFVLGEIDYVLRADDTILIDGEGLVRLLARTLSPADLDQLRGVIAGRERVPSADLIPLGLGVRYDPATFGLILDVATAARPTQVISVAGAPVGVTGPVERPAGVSGYITAYAVGDYVHRTTGGGEGFSTPSVLLDSALRVGGFVLENEATIDEQFSREGTRVVYDDLARTARYTVGDLQPIARGFSGATPLAGLSIVRSYADLEPQRNVQPRGQRSFTLDRAATVETFVNGRSVQQTRLGPGNYDIRDFPFAQGGNDVRLVIRDDTGRVTDLSFSINFDRTLLAPGLTEFGVFAGAQSRFGPDGIEYQDEFGASGFYRRGLSESLTAGANFQASSQGAVVGGEIAAATGIGAFGADLAFSSLEGIGEGYALNVGYERVFEGVRGNLSSVAATVQTTSANFATPGSLTANNRFAVEVGLSWSQSLSETSFISTDAFHSVGRDAEPDQSTLRATYGKRVNPRLLWTAEAVYEDRQNIQDYGVRLGLTYRFSPFSSGSAEIDTRRERARVGYQTSRGRGVGAWSASADLESTEGNTGLNATVTSVRNRAEVGASHQTFFSADGGEISDQRTSLRVGTSLAFADGRFAVSRPIYDSFALVAPHASLREAEVYVDPQDQFYSARSGLLGPAVVPDLSAYSPRLILYDAPESPAGYDLGPGAAQVLPPYRSGYVIEVGSDYFLSATGQLLQRDGTPLALWVGEAEEIDGPDRPAIRLFTNQTGRFAIQGLRPGRWRVSSSSPNGPVYILTVPADAEGFVRVGALNPETQP